MLVCEKIKRRPADGDATHAKLKAAVEKKRTMYLWVPGDSRPFKPALLPVIYGDGRALFRITTINQRPAYWVIRACSTWRGTNMDPSPNFGNFTDEILTDLEEAFGQGRCGYSGTSLFLPRRERMQECQCEECSDRFVARWPMVDAEGGCSWGRMNWPPGFPTVENPLSWRGNLLAPETVA